MLIIGIDPGLNGCLATYDGTMPNVHDMPTLTVVKGKSKRSHIDRPALLALLQDLTSHPGAVKACIERQIARPAHDGRHTGGASTANTMFGYGVLLMGLDAFGIPYEEVMPQKWQRHFSLNKDTKGHAVLIAQRLYPGLALHTPRGRMLDGRADAILLATWYWRWLNGGA